MDNLTHSFVGLAAAKAGLERASPYATAVCVIAANAPDADIATLIRGRWTYLENHRGLTHSILGTFTLALLIPVLFYAGDRLIARLRATPPRARFNGLLLASLVLSASHPLLDWTNSYGLRPLLPWSARWYYGDLVFIVDPWIWLSVGGAAFLLTARTTGRLLAWAFLALALTIAIVILPRGGASVPVASRLLWVAGIAGLIIAYRAGVIARWGAGVAAVSLALIVVYWGALDLAHHYALARAQMIAQQDAEQNKESLIRVAAMPMLANPLRWECVAETDRAVERFDLSLGSAATQVPHSAVRYEKPRGDAAAWINRIGQQDRRARIFLNFARFPVTRLERGCAGETLAQFADLRFTEPGRGQSNFALEISVPQSSSSEAP